MSRLLLLFSLFVWSGQSFACSYCRKAAPAGAASPQPANTNSTLSGSSAPMRVIAAKPAIDMNGPILLGDYSAGPEQSGLRKGNTEDFEVPTSEIFWELIP